jgi:hypothetical protein
MFQNTTSATGQIKYLVYSLEKAIMNLTDDQEKMVWLTDFQSWTLGSTPLKVTRETVNVLQDCYPERLGLAILHNPPRIFESFWRVGTTILLQFIYYEPELFVLICTIVLCFNYYMNSCYHDVVKV